ncbi:MAG: LysR family transcriptional regulator [Oscillospiraceae bacterium]|jgi:DNA-binding transcriptional LysR family regulator
MNVSLEHYRVFYYAAKLKSVTLASERLYISQPAVSQSLKQLEQSLGCALFFRTPKGVRLTPEGEVLFGYIGQGIDMIMSGERKLEEMLNLEKGEIRIGASDMTLRFYLLPFLEKFHKSYPDIKISVSNAPTPETMAFLKAGRIDFGIVSAPFDESSDSKSVPVSEVTDVFVAGSRFSWLKDKTVSLCELERLPTICLEGNTSTRRFVDDFLKENNVILKPEFELATSDLIVKFAERDMGIASVVRSFAEESVKSGALFELKLEKELPARKICILTSTKNPISLAGNKLLKTMI